MPSKNKRARKTGLTLSQERESVASSGLFDYDAPTSKSESHISEEDEEQYQIQEPSKKKAKIHTHLTKEQEEAMVDWLKDHEVLYNKKLEGYKDTNKKAFLWQMHAEVMGVSVDELKIWYTSLRTRFTKLKKKKSSACAPEHTDRDQWVLDKFSFLAPFTYEVKKRTHVGMTSLGFDTQQQLRLSTRTAATTSSSSCTPKTSDSFSSATSSRMDLFMEMQNRLMQQMARPNADRMKEVFIDYIKESVYDIHPTLWEPMHRDIMKTVLMYRERDDELKRGLLCSSTAKATAPDEPRGSSADWQPSSHNPPKAVKAILSTAPAAGHP